MSWPGPRARKRQSLAWRLPTRLHTGASPHRLLKGLIPSLWRPQSRLWVRARWEGCGGGAGGRVGGSWSLPIVLGTWTPPTPVLRGLLSGACGPPRPALFPPGLPFHWPLGPGSLLPPGPGPCGAPPPVWSPPCTCSRGLRRPPREASRDFPTQRGCPAPSRLSCFPVRGTTAPPQSRSPTRCLLSKRGMEVWVGRSGVRGWGVTEGQAASPPPSDRVRPPRASTVISARPPTATGRTP